MVSTFHTWDTVEEMILDASDDVKNAVYQCALAKKNIEEQHQIEVLKRRREYQTMHRNVRRRLGRFIIIIISSFFN